MNPQPPTPQPSTPPSIHPFTPTPAHSPTFPSAPPPRSRRCHIARFPIDLRNTVNRMLDDGLPYKKIIEALEAQRSLWPSDIPVITHSHIVRWRQGGYRDWLENRRHLDALNARRDLALNLLGADQSASAKLYLATLHLSLLRLFDALHQTNVSNLANLAAEKPASYGLLINALVRLTRGTLAIGKFQHAIQNEPGARPSRICGISPEALAEFERYIGADALENTSPPPSQNPQNQPLNIQL